MSKKREKRLIGLGREGKRVVDEGNSLTGKLWKIFNIPLFSKDINRVLKILESQLDSGRKKYWVITVNPEFVMEAKKDKEFHLILGKSNLNVVDGIGLIWARELKEKVGKNDHLLIKIGLGFKIGLKIIKGKYRNQVSSGSDLMFDLGEMAKRKKLKIFFLGGFGDRAKRTAELFKKKFLLKDGQLKWCSGQPSVENKEVIEKINKFKPDILLVAYGMKKQEFWINQNLKNLDIGLVMGIGRSFDYYSGELKRAPEGWRKIGLEWLYSLFKEPKRIKRQLVLPKFIWQVIRD